MNVLRGFGRILHRVIRYTLPLAIPLACALVAVAGISSDVYSRSRPYRTAHGDYWETRRRTGEENLEKREALRGELEAYIRGPSYLPEGSRRRAYYYLFELLREDPDADPEALSETIRAITEPEGIYGYSTFAEAAIALADRDGFEAEARELVARGFDEAREYVDGRQEDGRYDDEEEYQEALARAEAPLYDARGWLFLQQGQLEEAELDLSRALKELPKDGEVLYHMGHLYEAKMAACEEDNGSGDAEEFRAAAEDFYLRGTLVDWWPSWKNPNIETLEGFFIEEYGSLEGFDEHFAEAIESHTRERREEVLSERLEEPKALVPFQLENLAGGTVSSESLEGKVAVINFWGTWCGPCVRELPELQLFWEKYRDYPEVVVLTVSVHDDSQEEVREWMAEKEFTYPVLWDAGYNDETDLRGYPTTWFIDPRGEIQYSVLGTTLRLNEEFGWMVEALREEG